MTTNHRGPLPVLAVLGAGDAAASEEALAERIGAMGAAAGWVVLTGGGPGVMAAASRGAVEAGGLTVGILPCNRPTEDYPNPWVRIPVFTGAGSARNAFNVLSATLCIAIGGGAGTLSEVGHALKNEIPIWCWGSWTLTPPPSSVRPLPRVFDTAEDLLTELEIELAQQPVFSS